MSQLPTEGQAGWFVARCTSIKHLQILALPDESAAKLKASAYNVPCSSLRPKSTLNQAHLQEILFPREDRQHTTP